MKRKFIRDISTNTLQVIIVQLCGLVIFYFLSTRLSKNEFGEMNWALAVLLTSFGILSFGIDQITIKRIASGNNATRTLAAYIMHVLIVGSVFYSFLLIGRSIFHSFFEQPDLLLLLGIGKLMIFFSMPFKQLATGLEKFRPLLVMAICSNVLRSLALILFAVLGQINLTVVVIIFIAGDLAELLLCMFIMQYIIKVPVTLKWNKNEYTGLVKEALPQFGAAIFTSALSRLDWIFLGILASNVILAEYSFAYKVFEVSTLPMLVIAPVLIPRFTKLFHPSANEVPVEKVNDLFVLLRLEMIIAALVGLMLCILWTPVIDLITQNKYGSVNQNTILILSASTPFLYFNNFLWTVNFAKGRLKMIFYVFLISFLFNLAGDIILIPFFNAEGAAVAYLVAIVVQSILYLQQTRLKGLKMNSYAVLLCPVFAIVSGILATTIFNTTWVIVLSALLFYVLLLYFTKQIRFNDWVVFKRITGL
jgi:O-antigen/teichoic acid export membrane protein